MFKEEDIIIIKTDDGEEKKFYKLIQFYSNETHKDYLIYTDGNFEENKLNLYSSIIKKNENGILFKKITEEIDKKIVYETLKKELKNN